MSRERRLDEKGGVYYDALTEEGIKITVPASSVVLRAEKSEIIVETIK